MSAPREAAGRIAAVEDYLYEYVTGPVRRVSGNSGPLPQAAWEEIVAAEDALKRATRLLAKPLRRPVHLEVPTLTEEWPGGER
jgi:hypothetical protein